MTATSKNTIAKKISYVNDNNPAIVLTGMKLGVKITNPKAAADKFVNNPDNTLSNDLLASNVSTTYTVLNNSLPVNERYE